MKWWTEPWIASMDTPEAGFAAFMPEDAMQRELL